MTRHLPRPAGLLCPGLLLLALLGAPPAARAQSADSTRAAARLDGRRAAANRRVGGWFVASFLGGVALGFTGPIAVFLPYSPATPIAAAGALALVVGMARTGDPAMPDSVAEKVRERPEAYRAAFEVEFARRAGARGRRAVLAGGALGVAAGVGWLWWGLAHTDF